MFCPNCGNQLPDHAKFCNVCGNPVPQKMTPPAPAPVPPVQPVPQLETPPAPSYQAYQAPPQPQAWQAPPQPETWQAPPEPQYQAYQAPPQSQTYGPIPPVSPVAPPVAHPKENAPAERTLLPRDGMVKYILKRLIFSVIAIGAGILFASLFVSASPFPRMGRGLPPTELIRRVWPTLGLILLPIIFSFAPVMATGLVRSNAGKNVFRVFSAFFRSLIPLALAFFLIGTFGRSNLLPMMMLSAAGWVMPVLALTLPLTGFFMNAAVTNGHENTFGKSVGAIAHWAADRMPLIVIMVIVVESIFNSNGLGGLLIRSISQMDLRTASSILIIFTVIIYLLKLLMDVISALASGGDPAEQVYGTRAKEDKSGKVLFIIGAVLSGTILLMAVILPFTAGSPVEFNAKDIFLGPGMKGHILGTDSFGRDLFAVLAYSLRNTVTMALPNTVVACALGIGFGVLEGILPKGVSEIFKGIRYVFGFAAPLGLMLIVQLFGDRLTAVYFVVGLFSFGGIAERIGYGIRARKTCAPVKTALVLPALAQLVHTFCIAVIGVSVITFLGFAQNHPGVPTLGSVIAVSRSTFLKGTLPVLLPAGLLIILLLAFYLMHAGLSAMEKHLESEKKK